MPPPPETHALRTLLTEIQTKKNALAATSEEACNLDADELEDVVRHCVEIDAVLTVAQATILASLNAAPAVQS